MRHDREADGGVSARQHRDRVFQVALRTPRQPTHHHALAESVAQCEAHHAPFHMSEHGTWHSWIHTGFGKCERRDICMTRSLWPPAHQLRLERDDQRVVHHSPCGAAILLRRRQRHVAARLHRRAERDVRV